MLINPKNDFARKLFFSVAVLILFAGIVILFYRQTPVVIKPEVPQTNTNPANTNINSNSNSSTNSTSSSLPKSLQRQVAFTAQAPTANWDELHNQACEEVSAIIANAYFNHISSLPPTTVEKEITALTKWQDDTFGYHLSINTEETARMIEANYGLKTEIIPMSEQTIKQAIADGKLVLIPTNGQLLHNPNYKVPGPIYHMIVVTGYNNDTIITNDPGTRNGFNYKYSYDTLWSANGTWDHNTEAVDLNNKQIIIISK